MNPLVIVDGESGMSLGPRQWNPATSRVDLGYTGCFLVAVVNSEFL